MVLGIPRRLDQLVHDVLGRGHVGVAHAEVDDVLAAGSRLGLEVVDDGEDVRWQSLDSIELVHGLLSRSEDHTVPVLGVSIKRGVTRRGGAIAERRVWSTSV